MIYRRKSPLQRQRANHTESVNRPGVFVQQETVPTPESGKVLAGTSSATALLPYSAKVLGVKGLLSTLIIASTHTGIAPHGCTEIGTAPTTNNMRGLDTQ